MKYYSIHEFSKILGLSSQTLRNWDANGKLLPHHKSANGYRYYSEEQLNQVLKKPNIERKIIGYCRVSSIKQKDDLDRQVEAVRLYLTSQGKPFEIVTDVGSGINYKKSGLQQIIREISLGRVEKVVILYKDCLIRFGYELLEFIAELYHCDIEVIDNSRKSEEEELVEDLVQIITVFSCKLNGKRSNKAKRMIKELINDD